MSTKSTAKQVMEEMNRGKVHPVYLLYGSEAYFIDQVTRRLADEVVKPESADFDHETIDGDDSSLDTVLSRAQSLPWLGERRLVVVKRAPWFKSSSEDEQQALERYLGNPMPTTVLVFQAGTEVDRRKKAFKAAVKHGMLVECAELNERGRGEWISQRARELGIKLGAAALNHLVLFGGKSLYGLEYELEKLSSYNGGRAAVDLDTIKAVCVFHVEDRVFDVMDAVVEGKTALALTRTREVLGVGIPASKIFYLLVRHYRILYRAREGLDSRLSEREITAQLEVPPQVAYKYLRQAERMKKEPLSRGLKLMLDLDVDMKTGRETPENGLQLMIANLSRI